MISISPQIPEDTLVGTNISVVTAVDDDAGPHGHVTYKLLGKGKEGECLHLNPDYIVFIKMLKFSTLSFW